MFDISTYSDKKTRDEYHEFVSAWACEIISLDQIHRMHERTRDDKLMFEEALALAKYIGKYYSHENISIQPMRGSQNYDAILYDEKGQLMEYLEVTGIPREGDHVLRKEISEYGHYPVGSSAHQWPSYSEYAARVSEIILKKLQKQYPSPCTLLVVLSPDMVVEEDATFEYIIDRLSGDFSVGQFSKIVIFDLPGTHWKEIR